MSDCGCHVQATNEAERRILRVALGLNATMFVVGIVAGLIAQSMGLIADSLDMLADASAYGIALLAWARSASFKASAAQLSGTLLLVLGLGALAAPIITHDALTRWDLKFLLVITIFISIILYLHTCI